MVRREVWKAAGKGYLDGFLCVACLESRLGRPLTGDDLDISLPINYPGCQRDTPRLFSLKSDLWSGIDMDDLELLESLLCPRRSAL